MGELRRRVEVAHAVPDLYNVVAGVEVYPEFLPWMSEVKVLSRTQDFVEASLHVSRHGAHSRYTTRHWLEPSEKIQMELIDGPMQQLDSVWTFEDLDADNSIIDLHVEYEFNNPISAILFGTVFRMSFDSLLEHVIERANELHR